jgi:hypothetical protein
MEPSSIGGFIRKGRDLLRSAIITLRPRAAAVLVVVEGMAWGTKALVQAKEARKAKAVFIF